MSSNNGLNLVGNPNIARRDVMSKLTGKIAYTYDLNPTLLGVYPEQFLNMGVKTVPVPSAQITKIDGSAAEAAGYVVLYPSDLPPYTYLSLGSGRPHSPLPQDGITVYAHQPVCAVAAPTSDEVVDALNMIDVEYTPLPFVMDPVEAMAPGAHQIWAGGNLPNGAINPEDGVYTPSYVVYDIGNADAAIAQADTVVSTYIQTQNQHHQEMEPWAVTASWGPTGLTVHDSTEAPFGGQSTLATYFGVPVSSVRVIGGGVSGVGTSGFAGMTLGNKLGNQDHVILTAAMAQKAGENVTVKFGPTRADHIAITTQRFSLYGNITVAGNKANGGTFTAFKCNLIANSGAYGGASGSDAVGDLLNLYDCPNMYVTLQPVNTNSYHAAGAMRDVGESQGHYIMETAIDMLCQKMGVDPSAFRYNNAHGKTKATQIDPTTGFQYSGFAGPQAFQEASQAFNWSSLWKGWGQASSTNGTIRVGVGCSLHNGAKGTPSSPSMVNITLNPNGSILLSTGRTENGAGSDTAFPVMVGEALGLTSISNITVYHSDTAVTPNDGTQGGSVSTRSSGLSIIAAATNLQSMWYPTIAKALNTTAANITIKNGVVNVSGSPTQMTFQQAAALLPAPITASGSGVPSYPPKTGYRVGGGKFAMVQVDTETAEIRVLQGMTGLDIGRVIWATGTNSQVRGGFLMGISATLYEQYWLDPTTGQTLNFNLHDYRMATQSDAPDSIGGVYVEYVDPVGPWGAKGIGENCLMSVTPAITNALSNALGGYRFLTLPVTKADIVAAIQWAKQNGSI